MSIKNIQALSLNPHFISILIQSFLTGYVKPCEPRNIFFVAPLLFYKESREKLMTARTNSKMETIFEEAIPIESGVKLSGKVRLAGFIDRYEVLKDSTKKAVIILSSEGKIVWHKDIELLESISYKNYNGEIKNWLKAAYYLGIIMSCTTESQINYYFGIEE